MKTRMLVLFSIFLLVAAVIFISASCDNSASSGTLTVILSGIPSGSDGHLLYMGLYEGGADPMTDPYLAVGEIEIGTDNSDVLRDSETTEDITFDPGAYDLYLWIDMDDDFEFVMEPEQGVDMTHTSLPFGVVIDGDTTVTLISSDFELLPGWD